MELNKWIPCSDDNYWCEEDGYVTIVKYTVAGTVYTSLKEECAMGWNVLCALKAELMNIKL